MFHIITTYLSSSLILLSGLFLLMLKVPEKEEWRYLRISRIFIFLSYTLLALAGIGSVLYEFSHGPLSDRRALTLSVAYLQALLFTFISIAYIRPRYLSRKVIVLHIAAVLPFAILATMESSMGKEAEAISITTYILLLVWCTGLFIRQYRLGLQELETHFDEDFNLRMRWVKYIFSGALGIGILALVCSTVDTGILWYDIFIIVHTLFYMSVIASMRHCLYKEHHLMEVMASEPAVPEIVPPAQEKTPDTTRLDKAIKTWIEEERYLLTDISIDEVADSLETTHDALNEWCTAHYGQLFRSWRMNLRVEKAKSLLLERPDISIAELQRLSGFTDKSHFFKQFKLTTGMTPTEFRKKNAVKQV